MSIGLVSIVLVIFAFSWWWFIGRNTPKYPPLDISDDDPLMQEAIENAKSTINQFIELLSGEYSEAQIKVPFTSSSGAIEHLWAEVLEIKEGVLRVRYYTPPVTHEGMLERLHEHNTTEIEDWIVILNSGEIHGGFTQRVMFKRGREQWGELPPELMKQESKYVA
jgi:uncharacterized protein YegJ (DUF2314 family)